MVYIPNITEKRLRELYRSIKPVLLTDRGYYEIIGFRGDESDGRLFSEDLAGLRNRAFTWSPVLGENRITDISALAVIDTYHTCGHPVFFKPSIAEVLAQIPLAYIDRTIAFSTSKDAEVVWPNGEYHVTQTTLFDRIKR